jgi:hypothetical protein
MAFFAGETWRDLVDEIFKEEQFSDPTTGNGCVKQLPWNDFKEFAYKNAPPRKPFLADSESLRKRHVKNSVLPILKEQWGFLDDEATILVPLYELETPLVETYAQVTHMVKLACRDLKKKKRELEARRTMIGDKQVDRAISELETAIEMLEKISAAV